MISGYVKQVTFNKFGPSLLKRVALYAAEVGVLSWLAPGWFATPIRFAVLTAAGTAGKNVFWWLVSPKKAEPYFEEPLVFVSEEDVIIEEHTSSTEDKHPSYTLRFKSIPKQLKKVSISAINSTGNYIVNLAVGDVVEGTSAMIATTAAFGGLALVLGPPSLLTLPAFYVLEGPTRSLSAYCGRQMGKQVLGPMMVKPVIKSVFGKEESIELEEILSVDELAESFELMEIESSDDIADSFILICPPDPIVKQFDTKPLQVIDDYSQVTNTRTKQTPF